MTLADDLKKAKEEIQTRGRSIAVLVTKSGKCCPLGAIGIATIPDFEEIYLSNTPSFPDRKDDAYYLLRARKRAFRAVEAYANEWPAEEHEPKDRRHALANRVWHYNDRRHEGKWTSDEEILAAFDRAIEKAES